MLEKQMEFIRSKTNFIPDTALILGSGLGDLADEIEAQCIIDYNDIPDFPVSTAPSHKGKFVFGRLNNKNVVIMQGRVHLYEGYSPYEIALPIRLMKKMGAKTLFLTNAAGGIGDNLNVGDFMVITDHISTFVPSPLIGKNDDDLGVRFPDMSEVYSKKLNDKIFTVANRLNIDIKKGTYIQFTGPNFETPAEIKMAKLLGADAVGMSTAIEAQAARHCGFDVCAVSVISNLACGISKEPISSEEVEETAKKIAPIFKKLVTKSIEEF
ncbi:MAG: purine-nucleoside phosphorylase [Clostridiales bacterium]|nr:purine-nucleoside phosphorylase [Clostridiales bacterium]